MACAGNDYDEPEPAGLLSAIADLATMTGRAEVSYPSLGISADYQGCRATLRLAGELDVCNKDVLEDALGPILDRCPRMLVVDLSALGFMDCSGLSVLIEARQRLAADQGQVCLTGSQPVVSRLISLLGLDACLRLRGT